MKTKTVRKEARATRAEWLLLTGTIIISLLLAIGLIRWFAPGLLHIPEDLQVVRVGKKIAPFYEAVFRSEDYASKEFMLQDPHTRVRARPLFAVADGSVGPHDILGFRNRLVPNVVDILTIGDSQTYGNNVPLEQNWPSQVLRHWRTDAPVAYNIATGGWGAVQYLDMFRHATVFQPRVVVVAFYSGNDALESFMLAYSVERFAPLRPDAKLSVSDLPQGTKFPPPPEDLWSVTFKDGSSMTFSPRHRLASNLSDHPAVRAGYDIMQDVARRITTLARANQIQVVFTVIPTKELAFAKRIQRDAIAPNEEYVKLVKMEQENIEKLAGSIRRIQGAQYVDVVSPLQTAALGKGALYPTNENGHPSAAGYKVIADTLAPAIKSVLPAPARGLIGLVVGNDTHRLLLATRDGVWDFASERVVVANGWKPGSAREVYQRDIEMLPYRGVITSIDPVRYGPAAFQ